MAVTYLQFPVQSAFQLRSAITSDVAFLFSLYDLEPWPETLTFKDDLDNVKVNQRAKYII